MWPFRFAMRRKRGLPNMILYLLSQSPKNGVQLMDGVQEITRGWWRPTPGSIYPLLKEMTDEGLVNKLPDNRYELTEKGKSHLDSFYGHGHRNPRSTNEMVDQMHSFVSYMEDVKSTNQGDLEPHLSRLKELSKRLGKLVGEEGSDGSS